MLDACVVINLYATHRFAELLSGLPYQFGVAAEVAAEALYVRQPDPATGDLIRVPIDLAPHAASGLLQVLPVTSAAEKALFLQLVARLDDGEAASLALAMSRGFILATDE